MQKSGFLVSTSPKETGNPLSAPKAGLPGQKSIERTQKHVVWGVFGCFPKISKCPYAKIFIFTHPALPHYYNSCPCCQKKIYTLYTAFSFEDRSGATFFFEHVNFQPRVPKAQKKYFLQNGPYYRALAVLHLNNAVDRQHLVV